MDDNQTQKTRLFVGSLSWDTTDETLRDFFSQAGSVVSATVIRDRATNRSKGFGFVEMGTEEEAAAAIAQLHEQELDGRKIVVNEAQPKVQRDDRSDFRRDDRRDSRRDDR